MTQGSVMRSAANPGKETSNAYREDRSGVGGSTYAILGALYKQIPGCA